MHLSEILHLAVGFDIAIQGDLNITAFTPGISAHSCTAFTDASRSSGLTVTAFFTPGFTINNFWSLALAAIVLTVMDYLIVKFTGLQAMAFGKGFVGFVLAVVILYATQFFVAGYTISWMSAIIGALIYGVIDYILPGEQGM